MEINETKPWNLWIYIDLSASYTSPRSGRWYSGRLVRARAESCLDVRMRSVVAKESLGSRKRVASPRPFGPAQQQIT